MDALRGSLSNAESFGRGFGVAPVGLLGDINALAREYITPRLPANVQGLLQSMPSAPTTESILSAIPRMTPRRMETAGMEQIGAAANPRGPINLGRAVASLPSDIQRAGMEYLQASAQPRQIFVGPSSKTWNKKAADTAVQMEKAGASPRDIWEQTGTFRGAEGKLRQEISDQPVNANFPPNQSELLNAYSQLEYGKPYYSLPFGENSLGDVRQKIVDYVDAEMGRFGVAKGAIPHRELYKAYPEMQNIPVLASKDGDIYGSYQTTTITEGSSKNPKVTLKEDIQANAPNEEKLKSTLLHELQHGIQQREGFARGGNINEFASGPMFDQRARDLTADLSKVVTGGVSAKPLEVLQGLKYTDPKDIEPIIKKYGFNNIEDARSFIYDQNERRTPLGQYQRLAGEAEARLTQARMNLTPEQRLQYFPLEQKSAENPYGLDVNPSELIVRQGLLSP